MEKKVTILDYNMGNLFSVKNAFLSLGLDVNISSEKSDILDSDGLIIPGVGAFGEAMNNLEKLDLISPIMDFYKSGRPILGICLGLQLLFETSEEFGHHKGLGIIKGQVNKFSPSADKSIKVPHMGWNKIYNEQSLQTLESSPLKQITEEEFMYFVHSYYVNPDDKNIILTSTKYSGTSFCSSILYKNVFACQFHPEKSGKAGIGIFENWYNTIQ